MYTSQLKIVDTANFALWSLDRGAAFIFVQSTITCNPDEADNIMFLVGDTAKEFRNRWEAWECTQPDKPTDEIMRELWDEYY